jgi:hypothetical protein
MPQTSRGTPYHGATDQVTGWPDVSLQVAQRIDAVEAESKLADGIQNAAIDAINNGPLARLHVWGSGLAAADGSSVAQLAAVAQATGEVVEMRIEPRVAKITTALRRADGQPVIGGTLLSAAVGSDGKLEVVSESRWWITVAHLHARSLADPLAAARTTRNIPDDDGNEHETPVVDLAAALSALAEHIADLTARIETLENRP